MKLPSHKTKIVCTIGPASDTLAILDGLISAGMSIARLNFSHGDYAEHQQNIRNIRKVAAQRATTISILADLPGAKMRVGQMDKPVDFKAGAKVVLTVKKSVQNADAIPVEYHRLPESVSRGTIIYINDGFIRLKVLKVSHPDVYCQVLTGGRVSSHKGINLPGAKLFVEAVTTKDLAIVDFALQQGINIFALSFVESAADILKVRHFARLRGKAVYLVAKIERADAIKNFDEILRAADAIMVARGDLGVEIPIEEVPIIQKKLIQKANILGRPVITATQMLDSMTHQVRPTRAEVNDVANAILDGTDAVMLSEETAMGEFPVQTVRMMAKIAVTTESQREQGCISDDEGQQVRAIVRRDQQTITDVISLSAVRTVEQLKARYVLTPTTSGSTARRISRFKPPCWILAFSNKADICSFLAFSYGVHPFMIKNEKDRHPGDLCSWLKKVKLVKKHDIVVTTERRLSNQPGETDSLGLVSL